MVLTSTYCDILTQASFPSKGDGSLQSRAWQGILTGQISQGILLTEETLDSVAGTLNQALLKIPPKKRVDCSCPSSDNLIKNYWAPFKPVAHLWMAMQSFTLPEELDGIVRIDKAIRNETQEGAAMDEKALLMKPKASFTWQRACSANRRIKSSLNRSAANFLLVPASESPK